jgi:hypothetical protein
MALAGLLSLAWKRFCPTPALKGKRTRDERSTEDYAAASRPTAIHSPPTSDRASRGVSDSKRARPASGTGLGTLGALGTLPMSDRRPSVGSKAAGRAEASPTTEISPGRAVPLASSVREGRAPAQAAVEPFAASSLGYSAVSGNGNPARAPAAPTPLRKPVLWGRRTAAGGAKATTPIATNASSRSYISLSTLRKASHTVHTGRTVPLETQNPRTARPSAQEAATPKHHLPEPEIRAAAAFQGDRESHVPMDPVVAEDRKLFDAFQRIASGTGAHSAALARRMAGEAGAPARRLSLLGRLGGDESGPRVAPSSAGFASGSALERLARGFGAVRPRPIPVAAVPAREWDSRAASGLSSALP